MSDEVRWPLESNYIRKGDTRNTFGPVRRNADGSLRNHQGWDFYAATGAKCFAIADGKVVYIGSTGDYGNIIVHTFVHGGKTVHAAYAHMSKVNVKVGETVSRGQLIGLTGCSGNAAGMTGPDQHLHFEIRLIPKPGPGLAGRMSPLEVFREVPLKAPVLDPA